MPDLLLLEDQGKRLVLRPFDVNPHSAICRKGIALESNGARSRGSHLQDVVIPLGLRFGIFAGANRGTVLATAGAVTVEEGLGSAFVNETTGYDGDALVIADRHCAGLNHRLALKVTLSGHQRPCAVQDAAVARQDRKREQKHCQRGSGKFSGCAYPHGNVNCTRRATGTGGRRDHADCSAC